MTLTDMQYMYLVVLLAGKRLIILRYANFTKPEKKLNLIFTIDVEDKRPGPPHLIEGDFGELGNCGINYIMDSFEKRNMRAVFFVNIYEHKNYEPEYMQNVVKRISDKGHEVALHAHGESRLRLFKKKHIYQYSLKDQQKIIEYGCEFIKLHAGKRPIAFRGAGYECNEDTFVALSRCGIKYDSSCFYTSGQNKFDRYRSLNQVCKIGDVIEFPVIVTINSENRLRKLDLNFLDYDEIISVLDQMKKREGFKSAQLMFHSFSFIDHNQKDGEKPYFDKAERSGYGINYQIKERIENLLDYISNDPDINVMTFEQYDKLREPVPSMDGDGIFVCDGEKSREVAENFRFDPECKLRKFDIENVSLKIKKRTLYCVNSFRDDGTEYAWHIINADTGEIVAKGAYSSDNVFVCPFENDGAYIVKAFIRKDEYKPTSKSKIIGCVKIGRLWNRIIREKVR